MTGPDQIKIFDGHNDLAYQLWRRGDTDGSAFSDATEDSLHITSEKAKKGGLAAGLFALFVPQQGEELEATAAVDEAYALSLIHI